MTNAQSRTRHPDYLAFRWCLGRYAYMFGMERATQAFTSCSRGMIEYWRTQYATGVIPQSWGGKRWEKENATEIKVLVLCYILSNRTASLRAIKMHLDSEGHDVSRMYISRLFQAWRWSIKQPTHVAIYKFTASNINYYADFMLWIQDIDYAKIHYFDESYFRSKALQKAQIWGPSGQRSQVANTVNFTESFSLLLMTDLRKYENPYFVDLREGTVDQYDILNFFVAALEQKRFQYGDYLYG